MIFKILENTELDMLIRLILMISLGIAFGSAIIGVKPVYKGRKKL